jgi:hypothetical protein
VTHASQEQRPIRSHTTLLRSLFAVFAGYVTLAVVMMVLYSTWPQAPRVLSPRGFYVLSAVVGFWSAVAGGYLTAAVVPSRETVHALVLVMVTVAMEILQYALAGTRAPLPWWGLGVACVAIGTMLGSTARRLLPRGFLLRRWRRRR